MTCILLTIVTFGIYGIIWTVKTKDEINSLGAKIPTAWLMIVPIANIYFVYKYAEGFAAYVLKDKNTILWFLLYIAIAPVAAILMQLELNKYADGGARAGAPVTDELTARLLRGASSSLSLSAHAAVGRGAGMRYRVFKVGHFFISPYCG